MSKNKKKIEERAFINGFMSAARLFSISVFYEREFIEQAKILAKLEYEKSKKG